MKNKKKGFSVANYPRISRKQFKKWNEEMFLKYNNERVYHHPNPIIRFTEQRRVDAIIRFLSPIKKSDQILAAGCGEGYIEMLIMTGNLTLVDLSLEAIQRAKKKLSKRKKIRFRQADLEDLPFKDGLFNKIECSEVIEHVYSPRKMLKELYRVSSPDARLVISFPNENLINNLKRILIYFKVFKYFFPNIPENMLDEWHLRAMSLNEFKILSQNLWIPAKVKGVPLNLLPLRYVVLANKKNN